jgi:phosphosulfolactate synthase
MSNNRWQSLLDKGLRPPKPRKHGITVVLDVGLGPAEAQDLMDSASEHIDHVKIAWGSACITGSLERKIEAYRKAGVTPLIGGTMFEYCHLRGKVDELLAIVAETRMAIELSDGVASVDGDEKLRWLEKFAKVTPELLSEVGGKTAKQALDWPVVVKQQFEAGASYVVIEGREIGPPNEPIREDLVDLLIERCDVNKLIFEALERKQQVWLIKKIGPNVNLGNIRTNELLTVESFRRGLKEHTLLSTFEARR